MKRLSILIPCYNEGEKLVKNIEEIKKHMKSKLPEVDYEIICVNDGSTDNTKEIMNKRESDSIVKFLSYEKNKGKGGAIKYGVPYCSGSCVLFMDADLSTDLSAIQDVLDNIADNDLVIGSRRHKQSVLIKKQGFVRKVVGNACRLITRLITGIAIRDTQCGFKAVKKDILMDIVQQQTINTWAFDVEWLYIAKKQNRKVFEIPVIWTNDEDSKVSAFSSSIKFFVDLFKIRF